jgi:nucleoporin NUP159
MMRPASSASSTDIIEKLGKAIREFTRDIEQLELARNEDRATIRELEIGVLKGPCSSKVKVKWGLDPRSLMPLVVRLGKTRKEEIVRFDKARLDVEFGKMLKARVLNPEQTELQTQLRRDIRVSVRHGEHAPSSACARAYLHILQAIQDRVTKMEDHLHTSKKKLNEFKTGKPSIK